MVPLVLGMVSSRLPFIWTVNCMLRASAEASPSGCVNAAPTRYPQTDGWTRERRLVKRSLLETAHACAPEPEGT